MNRHSLVAVALAATLTLTACGSSTPLVVPTTTPTLTTDTFNGTIDVGGFDFKPFTVSQTGQIDITLTAAGPPATIFMGLFIGVPTSGTCAALTGGTIIGPAGPSGTVGIAELSGSIGAGTYCVQVYDVGNQAAQVTYTVTVTHS